MKILYLPLEPLHERYTEQWYRWFPEEFRDAGHEVTVFEGTRLHSDIKTGTFLDLHSSMHWFYAQLAKVVAHIAYTEVPDVIFFPDIEMWGIEGIDYLRKLTNLNTKLVGFLHAASYTKEDFMSTMEYVGKDLETAWINSMDLVFVGSKYHKDVVIKNRNIDPQKIIVTGNPFRSTEILKQPIISHNNRKYNIIISDRLDYEKRPHEAILHAVQCSKKVIVTTSRPTLRTNNVMIKNLLKSLAEEGKITLKVGISKTEYYDLLANSRLFLSTTIEENFGYSCVEAMLFGTIPIVPNNFSFCNHLARLGEQYHCLYNNQNEIPQKIERLLSDSILCNAIARKVSDIAKGYDSAIYQMINRMKEIC